jgi:hypothetical protein
MVAKGYDLNRPSDRERCALDLPPFTEPLWITWREAVEWNRKGVPPKSVQSRFTDASGPIPMGV